MATRACWPPATTRLLTKDGKSSPAPSSCSSSLPYNLIGHNCEIIANVCASQNWTESYQVRRWFGRKAAVDAALLLGLAALSRAGRSLPRWAAPVIIVWMVGSYAAIAIYNDQIRRLRKEIGDDWFAHERMLDADFREGES
jgi:hypothetical protein